MRSPKCSQAVEASENAEDICTESSCLLSRKQMDQWWVRKERGKKQEVGEPKPDRAPSTKPTCMCLVGTGW